MRLTARVFMLLGFILAVAGLAAAQPTTGNDGDMAWWGAGYWILITIVLLIGCLLFVVKGMKRPNRQ